MGSFKFRLVTYFVLLALLPVLAASWAFSEVAARGETRRVDARLNAGLRVAVADYSDDVSAAADEASSLARSSVVQQALAERSRASLLRFANQVPGSSFYVGDSLIAGVEPVGPAAERSAFVTTSEGEAVGRVVVSVPLNGDLVERLSDNAGLEEADGLVLVAGGRVIAGQPYSGAFPPTGSARYVELDGDTYRAAGTQILAGDEAVNLYALTPKSEVDEAVGDLRTRLLLFAFGALAFVAALAYLVGRTIVRPLKELSDAARAVARGDFARRVRVKGHDEFAILGRSFNDMAAQLETRLEELAMERARVGEAAKRFGDALAATHEPSALFPLIVQSLVDATGAVGGRLLRHGKEVARAGEPGSGGTPLEVSLSTDDNEDLMLLLIPYEEQFSDEARELARSLGQQAGVAIENVRLHRQVEREAITDGLTELPNRRQFEEALANEIGRVERFGGSLALILADLDGFKHVNDRYGHQAGDDVLRSFAEILRDSVREIDLPARYGGEEFAILLPQTELAGAQRLAERVRSELAAAPVSTRFSAPLAVTASFGVAAFPDEPTQSALIAAADDALYRAKRGGKNCVVAAREGSPVPRSQ